MLDETGYKRPTYSEILEQEEAMARELFGEDADVSSTAALGKLIQINAWKLSELHELVERVYYSGFLRFSEGVQLEAHGNNRGIYRNPSSESYAIIEATGQPGFVLETETELTTENDVHFMLIEDLRIDATGIGYADAVSIDKGADQNVAANVINQLIEPFDEITSVTNLVASSGGADAETDKAYRDRIRLNNEGKSTAIRDAVIAAIRNVNGVQSASVIINNTMQTDGDGNPPKSIHPYVLGGNREDIARALHENIPATAQTVGTISEVVKDLANIPHTYRFDYAVQVQIFVKVEATITPEFEVDGEAVIQDRIVGDIGGVNRENVVVISNQMGDEVDVSTLYHAIGDIAGIKKSRITIGTSKDNLSSATVTISPKSVAQTAIANIEVITIDN
ncbi:hypothetical protein PGRAN_02725 [Listeria grandensis FSL F6-0971]|uniref:Baseplate protein J-like barrel domain-containing protein n=1 Tax=Listeria grandensis FSL F6-0971 TaxID=1265819 RepID=W7BFY3_9LIST|nr:baseplate J/gp47 family protein [Listeria grandensis]EUJ24772.1 hypothetical protein PGRAN_02725 [Listeria grandensis FSL F6-0971]